MSDENETAAPPAEGQTATETASPAPVLDQIIDHDAPEPEETKEEPEAKPEPEKAEGEDDDRPKKLSGAQRAKLREQRLLAEIADKDRALEDLRRSAPARQADTADEKPPKEEDYNGDYFAWQRDLTAFMAGQKAERAIESAFEKRERQERETKHAEVSRERAVAHAERVEEAREAIPDFDDVMGKMKGVNVRDDVIEEIMSSDKSALLAYHLANNPEKLFALNSLLARELAREMGRLEATVQMPSAKKQTSAPPPLTAVKGGAAPSSQEASLNAWMKKTYG